MLVFPASKGKRKRKAMKNLKSILMLIGILTSISSFAQNPGSIRGQVIDSITNEPMIGANVYVMIGEQMIGGVTDLDGRFHIKPIPPGLHEVNISYQGQKKIIQMRVNPDQISMMGMVYMSDNMMEGIEVIAFVDPLINPNCGSVTTIRYSEMKNNPNLRDIKKMATTVGGVQMNENGSFTVRGGRSDATVFFVDGVKISDGNVRIPGVAIGSLMVYTGGIPAKYGDTTSGVIVVETRSYFEIWNEYNNR
jgi:hypothetical protein